MKIIIIYFLLASSNLFAQYPIGQQTITLNDASRNGRSIKTHIYYPSIAAGNQTAVATGQFPVVVIGHGFFMSYDRYEYLWQHLVPLGYIVALPDTETGLTPSHSDLGHDMQYIVQAMQIKGTTFADDFYLAIRPESAIMGHSMGGGASFLAVENDSLVSTMISLAAAETNPSAIAAANNINIPTLTIAGEEDCVSDPASNQVLMYDNLSDCKAYALITKGTHCQFADNSTACRFGESSCIASNVISRANQQQAVKDLITPWLATWLYQDYNSWVSFDSLVGSQTHYTLQTTCASNHPTALHRQPILRSSVDLYPNPVTTTLYCSACAGVAAQRVIITNTLGQVVWQGKENMEAIDVSGLPLGTYYLSITTESQQFTAIFRKL